MKIGNKSIEEIVKKDIFGLWDTVSVERARDELKKLYLKYYNSLTDIEEKRLILHNLCVAEIQSENTSIELVQKCTEILLNDMDDIEGYKENEDTSCKYCEVLNNYIDCRKDYISKDELIILYKQCNDIYEDYCGEQHCITKFSVQFNYNLIIGNLDAVFEIFKSVSIHNNDLQFKDMEGQFLKEIKMENMDLYSKALNFKNSITIKEII